jgi:uncharacterized repeat protein (TIGR01451 family)
MLSNKKVHFIALASMCLLILCGVAALGQKQLLAFAGRQFATSARPQVKVQLFGTVAREQESVPLEKTKVVNPGEILKWNIESQNDGGGAARGYKTVAPIPAGTSFVEGSAVAEQDASITYSIDGGKNFSAQPLIEEKQPDGSVKQVPAPVSMYTQVRYEWNDPLEPGKTFSASYKVRVR